MASNLPAAVKPPGCQSELHADSVPSAILKLYISGDLMLILIIPPLFCQEPGTIPNSFSITAILPLAFDITAVISSAVEIKIPSDLPMIFCPLI